MGVVCEDCPTFPALGFDPEPAEGEAPTVTVIKWSTVLVLTWVTTEVIIEGAAVSQVDAEPVVNAVDEAVLFANAVMLVAGATTFAETVDAGAVTVDVRLTISVTVARLAEVTVVGSTEERVAETETPVKASKSRV